MLSVLGGERKFVKRILIADDHLMFAAALQFLLQSLDRSIETVAVGSVQQALNKLEQKADFDLVLLDVVMPDMDGLAGLKAIKALYSDLPVAILSGTTDSRTIRRALDLGAIGWIPKTMPGEALIHALRLMVKGQQFCPPGLLATAVPNELFSPREREVGKLLAEGLSDKEIANRLAIEPSTVKVYVKKLLHKSGAENRTKFALMQFA